MSYNVVTLRESDDGGDSCFKDKLDALGVESGKAQLLNAPITSFEKLKGTGQLLFIAVDENGLPVGYVKVGQKNLYFYRNDGAVTSNETMCVLDFYVEERLQRHGVGRILFGEMLKVVEIAPEKLAYDRPSPKLISFLSKHYHLSHPDMQPNRYVIYDGFF